ncbi:MAG: hypothetical protein RLY66_471 [Candidatus Parcubacteria bacterium]|jgi:hypothetical protein
MGGFLICVMFSCEPFYTDYLHGNIFIMKKTTIVNVWSVILIVVILFSLFAAETNYSRYGGGAFGFSPHYILYVILYVFGYLYISGLIATIISIFKSSKILDIGERVRQIIAKSILLIFLVLPVIYYFFFW